MKDTKALRKLQDQIEAAKAINAAIQEALATIEANRGKIGFRFPYDQALHIKCRIQNAGFRIVRAPKGKA